MNGYKYEDIGFAKVDHHRIKRKGFPEVIYCQGKTPEQIAKIAQKIAEHGHDVLATRANRKGYNAIKKVLNKAKYYEAAKIEGAGPFQRMWHITLPLMRPIFIFCSIMSLIGTVYMFDEVFVLTQGGPGTSSTNFGLYLFNVSFVDFKFGYASCMAYTVAFFVFITSLFILRLRRSELN